MSRAQRLATLLLLFTSTILSAQRADTPAASGSNILTLDVVVKPGDKGAPVTGLSQSSFSILDNGAPQPIRSFRAVSGQPEAVKVLVVLDAVNLGFDRMAYERQELDRFLHANDGRLTSPTSLAILTDTGTQIQPSYTTDGNALSQLLDKQVIGLRDIRRSAGFYGAEERLQISLKALDQLVSHEAGEPGRKFIIWVTPGWPLLSGPGVELSNKDQQQLFNEVVAYSNALRRANITMYVVDPIGAGESVGRAFYYEEYLKGIKKPSEAYPADLGAQVLSVQSGGLYLAGNNDIGAQLKQCFDDAKAYYEIGIQPAPADAPNQYHSLSVRVAEPDLVARTRQGYYAQP